MNYSAYTDKDILEIHETMMDYSGKVDEAVKFEIEKRGGLEILTKRVEDANVVPNEIKRIRREVHQFNSEGFNEFEIKSKINSSILKKEHLDMLIEETLVKSDAYINDRKITRKTILICIVGFMIGTTIGTTLWFFTALMIQEAFHFLPYISLFITAAIVWLFTRQTRNNTLVWLTTFASAFVSAALGYCLIFI